jgi:hypothetical protein
MSSVVFAVPSNFVPPVPESIWRRFGLIWHGWDGSTWDLRDPRGGVFVTDAGLKGLHFPAFEVQTETYLGRPGRVRRDVRVAERSCDLPIYLYRDDGSEAWHGFYEAFMDSWHPMKPGTLELRTEKRTQFLELYLDSDGGHSYDRDPLFDGYSRYTMTATAEDPYWKGTPLRASWEKSDNAQDFFLGGNLNIATGTAVELASITNPGQVAAWAKWTIVAGANPISATISVDGGPLGTPQIPAGGSLVIDTDPAVGTAELDGVDVAGSVNPWDPRPIPAGATVPLSLQLTGFGQVFLEITPRRFRGL